MSENKMLNGHEFAQPGQLVMDREAWHAAIIWSHKFCQAGCLLMRS